MWQSIGEAVKPRNLPDETTTTQSTQRAESYPIEGIYGIGRMYSEALRGIGVETISEIAKITDIDEFEELLVIPTKVLRRIRLRTLSYASGEIMQAEPFEFPGERLIYIDIETDPARTFSEVHVKHTSVGQEVGDLQEAAQCQGC